MAELCDNCEKNEAEFEVRVQRPSDRTDMVCIVFSCAACCDPKTSAQLKEFVPAHPKTPVAATPEAWEEYMDSDEASQAGHLWLT